MIEVSVETCLINLKVLSFSLIACVAWRFKRARKVAKLRKQAAKSLGERQLRNQLQGLPTFFVSPVRWRTGHSYWIRGPTCQSNFR